MTVQGDIGADQLAKAQKPILLRQIGRDLAAAQTALSAVIDPLVLTAGGAQILVGFDAPRPPVATLPWLHFTLDGAPGAMQLPWGIARRLAGLSVENSDPGDAALLVEAGLAPWLDEAESALGISVRLTELSQNAPDLNGQVTLNLKGKDASGSFVDMRRAALLSLEAADTLIAVLGPRSVQRADLPGLDLRLNWECGALLLTRAELAGLRPGDALALSDCGPERIIVEGQAVAAAERIEGQGALIRFNLLSAFYPTGKFDFQVKEAHPMSEPELLEQNATDPTEGPAPDLAANIDDIDLRVSFHAGEVAMPLKALRALGPGSIIEMTDPATAVVNIVVNGRSVGTGELIDVGGRRAVQLRRLFAGA